MPIRTPNAPVTSPRLGSGDTVAVVAPSSPPTQSQLHDTVAELREWGFRVRVGRHTGDRWGFMAGCDEDRLADLNQAIEDPQVRAIVAVRGGAGAYRIADHINFDALRADPKPLVGFSDITNLHTAIWSRTGLVTIHGCLGRNGVAADVRRLLTTPEPLVLAVDLSVPTAAISVPGRAVGRLVGGNLRELAGAVGAGLPPLDGLLFIEDLRHVGLGQVDRNLTQLIRSGTLGAIAGVVLGLFGGFEDYNDQGWDVLNVLTERLSNLGVPVLGGIKAGHGGVGLDGKPDQRAIVLGSEATIDTETRTLTMGPAVH